MTGKNGSGKSTFIEAITFALFNKAYRDITKPALLNTINNKALLVELDFDIGPNQYTVKRGIKPAVFEIWINGEQRNSVPGVDDQVYLEDTILGMNYKTFVQTVIIGNATYTPFMQLTTPARRDIVEDLLDIRIYGLMTELLKKKVSDAKQRIKDIEDQISVQQQKINVQKAYVQTLHDDRERKATEARAKIAESQLLIDQTNEALGDLVEARDKLMEQAEDKTGAADKMAKLQPLCQKLVDNVSKLREEITFFQEHDDCPVCKQMINDEFKESAVKEREARVFTLKDGSLKLREQIEATQVRLTEISDLNRQIRKQDQEIADLVSKIRVEQRVVDRLNAELNEEQKATGNVDEETAKLKALAAEGATMVESKQVASEDKFYLDLQAIMLKDTGIKAAVIKQYVPIINKLINKYLNALDFFASFNLDENFNEVIKSRNRDELKYASFSEGEKLKIDLAILFTWVTIARMKNTVATNLLIFDEVTDAGLDTDSSHLICGILKDLSKSSHVFVISHHPELYVDKFDRNLKFQKINNYSILLD